MNNEGKEQLYAGFAKRGLNFTSSMSNFVLLKLGQDAQTMYERLLMKGAIVRYAAIWGLPQHVRVAVGLREENEYLLTCLEEVLLEQ